MKFLDNQKKVFGAGLACGLLLMWVQMNYYQNDWSIAPHPSNNRIVYAIEGKTGAINMIVWGDEAVTTRGLSDGAKLSIGERSKEPWEPWE